METSVQNFLGSVENSEILTTRSFEESDTVSQSYWIDRVEFHKENKCKNGTTLNFYFLGEDSDGLSVQSQNR